MSPSTVYDRVKKTGYMTGPNHRMREAMDAMQSAPRPAGAAAAQKGAGVVTEPPNLEDAGDGAESCGECVRMT